MTSFATSGGPAPVGIIGLAPVHGAQAGTGGAAKAKAEADVIAAARQAVAAANSQVDTDRRNHSPGCVACDQKLVDKAELALAQAQADAQVQSSGSLDITV